ncbi:uncharacterized protein LOC131956280 [Physella acuta]|uniref:uncharacterized protein LOC131956280 n=1 Tax=Physella acuta TaxID=109671 RepID=UPI0027DCA615|nr:uncharacterized protein LOC131956280 [Physella acuta]
MFQENEKEWILEAINHLKHRKARPDLSRISLRMKRKYLMSFAQTKKLLESLIESGIVVKAVYKNNTSYRDVSKWKKGRLGGQILNSNKMLLRFIRAIEATEKTKGTGVSAKCIEDYLASQSEEKCFLSGAALKNALEKEISNGFLKKRVHGPVLHYYVNPKNLENLQQQVSMDDEDQSQSESAECQNEGNSPDNDITNIRSRLNDNNEHSQSSAEIGLLLSSVLNAISETEQSENAGSSLLDIKEILVMKGIRFADDIFLTEFLENAVKKGLLVKNDQGPVAFYAENKNSTNKYKLCDASVEKPECTETEYEKNTSLTKCVNEESQELDSANLTKPLQGTWSGEYLQLNLNSAIPLRPPSKRKRIMKDHGPDFEIEMPTKQKAKHTSDNRDSVYPTPVDSPASEKSELSMYQSFSFDKKKRGRPKKSKSTNLDSFEDDSKHGGLSELSVTCMEEEEKTNHSSSYPDASGWTAQQVAEYFSNKGYTDEAQSMLEHDLDGTALGLLRRSDIVGPPLGGILHIKKLGVALKLFRDIRDLLYQGNAENYLDPYEERAFMRS